MVPSHGKSSGGFWMAGLLFFTWWISSLSVTFGALHRTIEDKCHVKLQISSLSLIYVLISTLAMFDEIAQDEEDAEDYDMDALERRTEARSLHDLDDDTSTLVGNRGPNDEVVFEIGDEEGQDGSDDEDHAKKRRSGSHQDGLDHEREGLIRDS